MAVVINDRNEMVSLLWNFEVVSWGPKLKFNPQTLVNWVGEGEKISRGNEMERRKGR